jgi:hypothetical protein
MLTLMIRPRSAVCVDVVCRGMIRGEGRSPQPARYAIDLVALETISSRQNATLLEASPIYFRN